MGAIAMVSDLFGTLLQELSILLKIPDLHADANNSCLIKFKDETLVQIEIDHSGEFLIVGSDLGAVPTGRYRENLFAEALKANGLQHPRYGTFAYSKQSDRLVIFEMLRLKELTGMKVAEFLTPFLVKAKLWNEAISKGDIPIVSATSPSGRTAGMFGLIP